MISDVGAAVFIKIFISEFTEPTSLLTLACIWFQMICDIVGMKDLVNNDWKQRSELFLWWNKENEECQHMGGAKIEYGYRIEAGEDFERTGKGMWILEF